MVKLYTNIVYLVEDDNGDRAVYQRVSDAINHANKVCNNQIIEENNGVVEVLHEDTKTIYCVVPFDFRVSITKINYHRY